MDISEITYKVLKPILNRAQTFLENDMKIKVVDQDITIVDSDRLFLKKNTVMIAIDGDAPVIFTFGYDELVLDKLVYSFTDGEKFSDDEIEEIRESVSLEVVNTIVGNGIVNPKNDSLLTISPPEIMDKSKYLVKSKDSILMTSNVKTEFGNIELSALGPKMIFEKILKLKEK